MANLVLESVSKSFGKIKVIHDVDLAIEDGEFVVFVGPSGCGKSTLLRMVAGLEEVTTGRISIDGDDVTTKDPSERGIAMVFQSYALYPHLTVGKNLGFSLRMNGSNKADTASVVRPVAEMLQLGPLLDRKPAQLSGGQRQRVAIGRALVRSPKVFLFDEPLSNLDAELRVQMRVEIARLHETINTTMIYVTHDQVEAMTLADRIVVLRDGQVEQVGAPLELYDNPDNTFVAGFIGSPKMNFMSGLVTSSSNGVVQLSLVGDGHFEIPLQGKPPETGAVVSLGIRPEHLNHAKDHSGNFDMLVDYAEHLGGVSYVYGAMSDGTPVTLESRLDRDARSGATIPVSIPPDRAFLFADDGQRFR